MRLKNKLAVISAAASGMGRAGCELFAREGAKIAAVDINQKGLDEVVDAVKAAGGEARGFVADLSREEDCRRYIGEAADWLGGLDILWAHAGTPGPAAVEDIDIGEYDKAIMLNLTQALLSAGAAAPHMRRRGGGSVVFTASVSGLVGSMFSPVYSAAKFGVVGLTKSLAQRFAPDRIRVNVVCPGPTETPMLPQFVGRVNDPAVIEENKRKLMAAIPLGRVGLPEEMAEAALWLASDHSSYVTGVALPVDGGFTAR